MFFTLRKSLVSEYRKKLRIGRAKRITSASAVGINPPAIISGGAVVTDVFRRSRSQRTCDISPRRTVPFLQIQIEIRTGRSGQCAGVRTARRTVIVRTVRLIRVRAGAGKRSRIGCAAASGWRSRAASR